MTAKCLESGTLTSAPPSSPGFLRAVSRWEIVALSINDVIGSGVYLILPVAAAQLLGPASVWAILAAGFAVLLIVLCFAEAGSLFDKPGGAYVYTRAAFGEFVGFEVGWMTWIARDRVGREPVGLLFARGRIPLGRGQPRRGPGGDDRRCELAFLTWINVRGVKSGARTAVVLAFGKIVPLVLLVLVGLFAIDWSRVFPVPAPGLRQLHEGRAARPLRLCRLREHVRGGGGVSRTRSATCRSP